MLTGIVFDSPAGAADRDQLDGRADNDDGCRIGELALLRTRSSSSHKTDQGQGNAGNRIMSSN